MYSHIEVAALVYILVLCIMLCIFRLKNNIFPCNLKAYCVSRAWCKTKLYLVI